MSGGYRTSPLPTGWKRLRQQVLNRDQHRCTWTENDQRCTETTSLEVDHICDRDDHHLDNLRTLCAWHHAKRTGHQAYAASNQALRRRPQRRHPGLI